MTTGCPPLRTPAGCFPGIVTSRGSGSLASLLAAALFPLLDPLPMIGCMAASRLLLRRCDVGTLAE